LREIVLRRARELLTLAAPASEVQAESVRVDALGDAARDVLAERKRQIDRQGWTHAHDDAHEPGDMARAAASCAINGAGMVFKGRYKYWPWSLNWFKPSSPRRDLVKAGALILTEIERIDLAAPASSAESQEADS
jgi:hypothetical protein